MSQNNNFATQKGYPVCYSFIQELNIFYLRGKLSMEKDILELLDEERIFKAVMGEDKLKAIYKLIPMTEVLFFEIYRMTLKLNCYGLFDILDKNYGNIYLNKRSCNFTKKHSRL